MPRRAAADASSSDVRGFCTLVQLMPFCWRRAMTFDQEEPSANSPWTKTTFFVFVDVWALATRLSKGTAALAAAAPINVRRFIMASPIELSVTVASKSLRRFGVACSEVSVLRERRVQQFLFACSAYAFSVTTTPMRETTRRWTIERSKTGRWPTHWHVVFCEKMLEWRRDSRAPRRVPAKPLSRYGRPQCRSLGLTRD